MSKANCGCNGSKRESGDPCAWFDGMIDRCYEYATDAKSRGRPIVGILCEYTPRELIMAAGGVPICLCGGSDKTIPAAEKSLPANLCPLIKSTFGYHALGNNPFLEMADLVVGETTCDGKKKMYEMMAETRPMHVLELPQRSDGGAALKYWLQELRRFRVFLAERFDVEITDEKIRKAITTLNKERRLRRELAGLMKSDRPPLVGRQILNCKSVIWGMPDVMREYKRIVSSMRKKVGEPHDGVRVLMTGSPMVHGAERVLDIAERSGGLVVVMENCTGVKPLLDDVDAKAEDPMRALAEKYYHLPCSVMTPNSGRFESIRRLVAEYRCECVVELVWQACLTYDVESHRVKKFVEDELDLPYLRIETDYSPSDSARIALRVEALFETALSRRQ